MRKSLRLLLVAFAILGSREYMDVILLQLTLWEYQAKFEHPVMEILKNSLGSFVGEDIELFNRLLSQHSRHDRRRGDAKELDVAYRTLGVMVHNGQKFNSELLECQKFLKGNRRYIITEESDVVEKTRVFLQKLLMKFAQQTFQHYQIRRVAQAQKGPGRRTESKINKEDYKTMKFSTVKLATAALELDSLELIDVRYMASENWEVILSEKFNGLMTRGWRFKELLKPETIERFRQDFPHYLGEDDPGRRAERKSQIPSRKRKR